MRKKIIVFLFLIILVLAGCGKAALRDGVYTGRSGEDDTGAWGEVTVTLREGKVQSCEFVTWQKDGTAKGEDYGKINGEISNQDYYDKAQLAVRAMKQYESQYAAAGDLSKVEAVSGATIAYDQFLEAAENALRQAK
jgi:major membrane immunogen (membrane-anchored lipoprotein)